MYHIYIFSQPDKYDGGNRYELADCETGKMIIKAKTKYEFKLKWRELYSFDNNVEN